MLLFKNVSNERKPEELWGAGEPKNRDQTSHVNQPIPDGPVKSYYYFSL
jgi:hypothetical protein